MRPRCCAWKWAAIPTTRSSSPWWANCQRAVSYSGSSGHLRTCGCTDTGRKRVNHPVVGRLDLNFESMDLPTDPGLQLNVYTAPAGGPAADNLALLASWAGNQVVRRQMSWRFQLSKGTAADPRCEGRYRLRGFSVGCCGRTEQLCDTLEGGAARNSCVVDSCHLRTGDHPGGSMRLPPRRDCRCRRRGRRVSSLTSPSSTQARRR